MASDASSWERSVQERLSVRDSRALAEVYGTFSSLVFGVALRVTGDRHAAEDVTQAVFARLWQGPTYFDAARGRLGPWLATVSHHAAVDWIRRERAARQSDPGRDTVEEWASGTEDTVASMLMAERVQNALEHLPEQERVPIRLAYFGGLTYRQVARELDVPEGTIKSRIRSGLRHLAERMGSEAVAHAT